MELKKSKLTQYSVVAQQTTLHEESMDVIVPDTYPDIEMIRCTFGEIDIREKVVQNDRVMVSGNVRAMMSYEAEGQVYLLNGLIPFAALCDAHGCKQQDIAFAIAQMVQAESKILNPRKYTVSVQFTIETQIYTKTECEICEGITGSGCEEMQMLTERQTFLPVICVQEKTMTIQEENRVNAACTAEDQLLFSSAVYQTEDVRVLSNKVMLRGNVKTETFLSNKTGRIFKETATLPFSQIVEVEAAESGDAAAIFYAPRKAENMLTAGAENELILKTELTCDVCVKVTRTVEKEVLLDAFHRRFPCSIKYNPFTVNTSSYMAPITSEIHMKLETEETVGTVVNLSVAKKEIKVADQMISAVFGVSAVYLTAENAMRQCIGNIELAAAAEGWSNGGAEAELSGVNALPMEGGLMIDGSAVFRRVCVQAKKMQVTACEIDSTKEKQRRCNASLILRSAGKNETVWAIAKDFSTSPEAILAANHLDQETTLKQGQLIMIPMA